MKWKVGQSFFVVILVIGLLGQGQWAFADNYSQGVDAYKRGDYPRAIRYLAQASRTDNPKALFYLALSYSKSGDYKNARDSFEKVGQLLPANDPLAVKARNNMAVLTQAQMTVNGNTDKAKQVISKAKQQNNYLAYAIPNGKVIHWDVKRMPLKVFIADGSKVPGWNPEMANMVQESMQTWQTATHGKVRFTVTTNINKADMVVRWKRNFEHNKIGENPFESMGDTIVRSDLNIATYYGANGPPMPMGQIAKTILHEMGHALGIQGHSPYREDIMYFSEDQSQGSSLTARDIATINLLYKLEADIKNSSTMATAQSKTYFQIMRDAVTKQAGNNPKQAIVQYQKALTLNRSDPDLYFNLALAYYQTGDVNNAIANYRKVLSLNSKNYDAKYNLGILLLNDGVSFAEQKNAPEARNRFAESVALLEEVLKSPSPPTETQRILNVARKNLAAVS